MSAVFSILVWVMMAAFYFLPSIIAWRRGHLNTAALFILNLLLGWTILGWIICLVWSLMNQRRSAAA